MSMGLGVRGQEEEDDFGPLFPLYADFRLGLDRDRNKL